MQRIEAIVRKQVHVYAFIIHVDPLVTLGEGKMHTKVTF